MVSLIPLAAEYSERYLSGLGARWLHVQGVVAMAVHVTQVLNANDREYLVASAYLHDIGYSPELVHRGFHPIDGAAFVLSMFGDKRLASLVAHHSGARFEAQARQLVQELRLYHREQSALVEALNYCDMLTSPIGQRCTLAWRYQDIISRYGSHHFVVRSITKALPSLTIDVVRTTRRLKTQGLL